MRVVIVTLVIIVKAVQSFKRVCEAFIVYVYAYASTPHKKLLSPLSSALNLTPFHTTPGKGEDRHKKEWRTTSAFT